MSTSQLSNKEALIKIIDELPAEKVTEILDFASFIKERIKVEPFDKFEVTVKTASADHYKSLAGIVKWGGDALEDSEHLYDS